MYNVTKAGHLVVALSLSAVLKLDPLATIAGAVLPDKDLLWGWDRKGKRTLWNAHRGFTHHAYLIPVLLFAIVLSFFLLPYPYSLILQSFCVGYVSHLLTDTLTPLGIPYTSQYYPRLSFPLFKTGSFLEMLIIVALGFFLIAAGKNTEWNFASLTLIENLLRGI